MMKHYVRLACFVGGALFGSVGILAAAKDINEARAAKEAEAQVDGQEA